MEELKTKRIMIVDDHYMLRQALSFVLKAFQDMMLVGQASSGREAVELCTELNPDVILIDLVMPEMNGVEAIRAIRAMHPHIKFIALTSLGKDAPMTIAAIQAGANAYLSKQASVTEVIDTIRLVTQQ
ncbi:MAG: response regulator transcription factor [Anaerolineae bacterium]